jgi:hypothetical protein
MNPTTIVLNGETLTLEPVKLKRLVFAGDNWHLETRRIDMKAMRFIVSNDVIDRVVAFLRQHKTDAFRLVGSKSFNPETPLTVFGDHLAPIDVSDLLA